jgi:MSHA pilin protein MshC
MEAYERSGVPSRYPAVFSISMCDAAKTRRNGFTLVELIVIIVIVGIVALIAAPRFFARSTFDAARFHEAAISAIRYGQKVAQAQHTDVFVVLSANTVSLCYIATCASTVTTPGDSTAFVVTAPTGIGLTGSGFSFNSLGQPNPNAMQTLTVTGDTVVRQIVVEQETGYVHK